MATAEFVLEDSLVHLEPDRARREYSVQRTLEAGERVTPTSLGAPEVDVAGLFR